ncbi:hypothetical protein [Tortoise microvirus 70]|nr:hypothetical protein [Tortoise microvirus 70]
MAVDIVHFGRYWDLSPKEWAVVGLIGKEVARRRNIKIVWGGDWRFWDPAHWELKDWKALRVPDNPLPVTFSQAFRKAREAGALEFVWNGKRYNTRLA